MILERKDTAEKLLEVRFTNNPSMIEHSKLVSKKAVEIGEKLKEKGYNVDLEKVEIGSLLHDIGRSVTHGIRHGVEGGKILRRLGFSESIARIVERHIGSGIVKRDAEILNLPNRNLVPTTLEEKIVCYADKHVESRLKFSSERREETVYWKSFICEPDLTVKKFEREFGPKNPITLRLKNFIQEMDNLIGNQKVLYS